jgi:hypothetical protein
MFYSFVDCNFVAAARSKTMLRGKVDRVLGCRVKSFLLYFYNRVTISSGARDSIVVVGFFFVWPRTLTDDKTTRSLCM